MDQIFMPEDHMEKLYNSKNPLVKFAHRSRPRKILKLLYGKNGSLLDAGCGEGHLLKQIEKANPSLELYGIDITENAVKNAKKKVPNAVIEQGNLLEMDKKFGKEYFDIVVCSEVLEHVSQYKLVIKNLENVLKTSGCLIVTFPNEKMVTLSRFFMGKRPFKVPDHINSFTPEVILKKFKSKLIHKEHYPFNLPFGMMIGVVMCLKKES